MNPKKKSRRCRASVSIQALDLAISRFIHSFGPIVTGPISQGGMHYLRNASSKEHIVQGTQYPGDIDSQTDQPGTHCSGIQHPVIDPSTQQ
jgi:hypothetical protein